VARRNTARKGAEKNGRATTVPVPEPITTAARIDRVIHEPVRLGIVSALAVNDRLSFRELRDLLETTDGNLSVHARKLEEASYVSCTKQFDGRTPKTEFRITASGRRALEAYLDHMDALIQATRK
jgi:DNA-binding MarR family transcriptional regulator